MLTAPPKNLYVILISIDLYPQKVIRSWKGTIFGKRYAQDLFSKTNS